jgi:Transglutaminase-like superfamily
VITEVAAFAVVAEALPRLRPLPLSPTAKRWNSRPLSFWARASLAVEVFAAYLTVRRRISRAELPPLVTALRAGQRPGTYHDTAALDGDLSLRLGFAVQTLLRHAPGDGLCLVRALVLTRLLARRQISARLVIGVRSEPSFSAHAWVEYRGRPLLPTDAAHERLVEL